MNEPSADQTKKSYSAPEFHAYGDIRAMTQNVGATANFDGGGAPNDRSQV